MKIYNTLSGRKEEFTPRGDAVKMYVCGVTPYAPSHLGHAMSYIVFDTIRRYLEFRGYKVKYVQNFTDIDDKIIARANETGISARDLSQRFIDMYFADMDALNIKRADIYPRATDEIPKIIEIIEGLIRRGHAYQAGGDVYFRVNSEPDYGKLSHRTLDGMMAGARIEVGESKEHPLDFALWKASKPGEPHWHSPWGQGRPGWHIECSAMSLKYLGETLDIHGGGQDLIFPHHENEIAQSEGFTGVRPFVRYWLHNGLMQLGEQKMSKSTGKLIGIRETLSKYSTDSIRLWVLSSHYRSPITYSDENLEATDKGVERAIRAANIEVEESEAASVDAQPFRERFIEAMDDDFNTPQAVAALFDLAREINRGRDEGLNIIEAQRALRELGRVLGLTLRPAPARYEIEMDTLIGVAAKNNVEIKDAKEAENIIRLLSDKRLELRRARKYGDADNIRNDLKELGITLEDTPQGTVWRYKKP
ncbi:MAG: cysteine--tRNA ligase [Chloroflexi bacterium]|nr:cysteine--tRNA ligase [Chloroflexota bacterium]